MAHLNFSILAQTIPLSTIVRYRCYSPSFEFPPNSSSACWQCRCLVCRSPAGGEARRLSQMLSMNSVGPSLPSIRMVSLQREHTGQLCTALTVLIAQVTCPMCDGHISSQPLMLAVSLITDSKRARCDRSNQTVSIPWLSPDDELMLQSCSHLSPKDSPQYFAIAADDVCTSGFTVISIMSSTFILQNITLHEQCYAYLASVASLKNDHCHNATPNPATGYVIASALVRAGT